jgi:hypothetical protein
VGIGARQWVTCGVRRTVAVAVHTVVAGQRLLDVVGLLETDPRVQVVYTAAPDVFCGGVDEFLHRIGALEVGWQQATREQFDLVLSAAYGGLDELHGPVMVLPHGAGYAKQTPRSECGGRLVAPSVYGLGAEHLVQGGRVVPASIVLSHEAQRDRLARQCPAAVDAAVVAGDPCYDRLRVSVGLRSDYQAALGMAAGEQLVVVASTWGRDSLFSRRPDLVSDLVRQLDSGRFRVAVLVHPAAWFGHGRRQMQAWLTKERAAGVLLMEPEIDWRTAIVAADFVIGDHGSVGAYAASIGIPVVHTDAVADDIDGASAQSCVAEHAARLRLANPIEPQLRQARTDLPPELATMVTSRLTSQPGQSHRLLRQEMYRLLDLTVPGRHRAVEPVAVPDFEGARRYA